MSKPTLILQNMRGSCATDGDTVHALFRYNGRSKRRAVTAGTETISAKDIAEAIEAMASFERAISHGCEPASDSGKPRERE